MVLGNILHGLFQQSITNKKYDKSELKFLLMQLLQEKKIINQLYESNTNEEFILKEAEIYLTMIEKWLQEHVKIPLGRKKNSDQGIEISFSFSFSHFESSKSYSNETFFKRKNYKSRMYMTLKSRSGRRNMVLRVRLI